MVSDAASSRWRETPRAVFSRRFADLYAAAGNPTLRRVQRAANARATLAKARGETAGVSIQRISDWRAGRNIPAKFDVFQAVLLTLIDDARRTTPGAPAELLDRREWLRLWRAADGWNPDDVDAPSPYLGLTAYGAGEAEVFFGRARQTAELADLVRATVAPGGDGGIVVLVAASGAGKSSLLHAGLVPALADSAPDWSVASMTPTARPLAALKAAVSESDSTADVAAAVADWAAAGPRLLIVDQLEELFTQCADDGEREAFLTLLAKLAAPGDGAATAVVAGLRADFYAPCLAHPVLESALKHGSYLLGPMRLAELGEAISRPAELAGYRLEPGLDEVVITELCGMGDRAGRDGYDPAALPLLSHVMAAAWQRRDGGRLTIDGYRGAGGVAGSVAATAEQTWADLDAAGREAAKHVLLRLVAVGQDSRDTRRRAPGAELAGDPADRAALDALVRARLVTQDADVAYLTHEVVLDAWPRLRTWIDEDRVGYLERQRLHSDATEWERHGRDPSRLYRGARLGAVEPHAGHRAVAGVAREFLIASRAEHAAARRRAARTRSALLALTAVAVVVAVVAVFGFIDATATQRRADADARTAIATHLAQDGEATLEGRQHGSDVLAMQGILAADALAPSPRTAAALVDAVYQRAALRKVVEAASAVETVAFDPTGTRMVSGGDDGAVRLWDALNGKLIRAFPGHSGPVRSVAFAAGGLRLVSGGDDGTVQMWDVATGAQAGRTACAQGAVKGVAVSRDGRVVATGGADGTVRVWDAGTGAPIGPPLRGSGGAVTAVAVNNDGTELVSAGRDGMVRLWDTATGAQTGAFAGHRGPVWSVAFNSDGSRIVSGGIDGTVRVWSTAGGPPVVLDPQQTDAVWSVAFSPDGTRVVSGTSSGRMRLWDVAAANEIGAPLDAASAAVTSVAFSPNGGRILSGSLDHTVRLWNSALDQAVGAPMASQGEVRSVGYSPRGDRIAAGGQDGAVTLWDTTTGLPAAVPGGHDGAVTGVAFSPDGGRVASTGVDGTVRVADAAGPAATVLDPHAGVLTSVAFSPDGARIATGGEDGVVRVWDAAAGAQTASCLGHVGSVTGVAFSPDGRRVVSGGVDGTVRLWDARTGREQGLPLRGHVSEVTSVAFSRQGDRIASGGFDNTIRLWDASTGAEIGVPLTGHTDAVTSVAFSPGGDRVVSASGDRTVRLWDVAVDREIGPPLRGHGAEVKSVAFSPTGDRVASGSYDGAVRQWIAPPTTTDPAARNAVCAKLTANMNPADWRDQVSPNIAYQPTCPNLPPAPTTP